MDGLNALSPILGTHLFARLLLVFSFVLPNLVWAKVAVVNVSGAVDLGMKVGTGLGELLNGVGVGDDRAEAVDVEEPAWLFKVLGRAEDNCWLLNGEVDLFVGMRESPPRLVPTVSIGRKHCASGLNVLVTSLSAELSSCTSSESLKRIFTAPFSPIL